MFEDDYGMTDTEWYWLHPEDDQESIDCQEDSAWLNANADGLEYDQLDVLPTYID